MHLVPPSRTTIRSTHPEPQVAELPLANVVAELSSFQGPVELPVSTNVPLEMGSPFQSQRQASPGGLNNPAFSPPSVPAMPPIPESPEPSGPSTTRRRRHGPSSVEPPTQPSPILTWLDMDEGRHRQSSIAAPRHAFSGYSNGGTGTTKPQKKKKRDELGKPTREQQPRGPRPPERRERDKAERVQISKEATTATEKVMRKRDTIRAATVEEQEVMEDPGEKEQRDKDFMNDGLKALGYTDEEIDGIMNRGRKDKRERGEPSLLRRDISASYVMYVAEEEDPSQWEVLSGGGNSPLGGGSVIE